MMNLSHQSQMIVELPESAQDQERAIKFFRDGGLSVTEVEK